MDDVTILQPATMVAHTASNINGPWSPWASGNHTALWRRYKPDPVATIPDPRTGAYEWPTPWRRFVSSVSGTPGEMILAKKYSSTSTTYWRYVLQPMTSNYVGPKGGPLQYWGCQAGYPFRPNIPLSLSSEVRARLISRFRSSDFDFGTSLGEIPETFQSIGSLVEEAGRRVKRLKSRYNVKGRVHRKYSRTKVQNLRKFGNTMARSYLGTIFGLIPIMMDIYSLMEYLENGLKDVRLTTTVEQDDLSFGPPPDPASHTTYSGTWKRGMKESATCVVVTPALFEAWRLGLTNPLSIAWELVTLSFVVDWFLHVGSFLSALQQPVGVAYKHGYTSSWCNIDGIVECRYKLPTKGFGDYIVQDKPMRMNYYQRAFYRDPLVGFVPPLPYLDLELNWRQLLTGAALLTAFLT